MRTNSHGQVKTSRNVKRPKPPLPPIKRTPKAPLWRSERNKDKKQVQYKVIFLKSIPYKDIAKYSAQILYEMW